MHLSWIAWTPIVQACGVGVHLELVDRIVPVLPQRIARHYNYIRSGAFYPDAFYNCQGQYDVAEDAHWPPFLAKGIELVHQRRAQGSDTSRLEAFLVGIMTHQVSDVSWHSLGLFQGLLRAMADSEFEGDYDRAHTVLDVGGDMVLLSQHVHKDEKSTDWEYDVEDIMDLLRINGYNLIPSSSIHFCMARGQAAYAGEISVANVAFKRFARRSPLMFDYLETYAVGGLTDMHEQILECLPTVLGWMGSAGDVNPTDDAMNSTNAWTSTKTGKKIDGIEEFPDPWSVCAVFAGNRPSDKTHFTKRSIRQSAHDSPHYMTDVLEILGDLLPNIGKKWSKSSKQQPTIEARIIVPPLTDGTSDEMLDTPVIQAHSSLFGSAIKFWDSDIVVGAPGEGIVYILDETGSLKEKIRSPVPTLKHPGQWPTHFGAQLEIWDRHLVISSPGLSKIDIYNRDLNWVGGLQWPNSTSDYGQKGLKMVGEILIVDENDQTLYVGAPHADHREFHETDADIWIDQAGYVYALPLSLLESIVQNSGYFDVDMDKYLIHRGVDHYDKAGAALGVTARFILVGVPGKSQVFGLDFATKKPILTLHDPSGTQLSGFGQYMLTGTRDCLVIGSPSAGENQEGVISLYKHNHLHTVKLSDDFAWFGERGIIVGDKVVIASPHANEGQGLLWEVDLASGEERIIGTDTQGFASNFGASMATNGTVVAIGMPRYGALDKSQPRILGAISLVRVETAVEA